MSDKNQDTRDYYRRITSQPISAVASELLPERITDTSDVAMLVDCPKHASQSKTSLRIDLHQGLWHCFGCRVGGDVLQLVEFVQSGSVTKGVSGRMTDTHREARDWLAQKVGLPSLRRTSPADGTKETLDVGDVFEALTILADVWCKALLANSDAMTWLSSKYGITEDTIRRLRIGYAGGASQFEAATREGIDPQTLAATGCFRFDSQDKPRQFFQDRIVFPYWSRGRVVYAIGRKTPWTENSKWEQAKYKKLPVYDEKKHPRISKAIDNSILWGEDILLSKPKRVVVAEGITDAIAAYQSGFPTISPVTVRIKKTDLSRIAKALRNVENAYLVPDNELSLAGSDGARATASGLETHGTPCRIVELPLLDRQRYARKRLGDLIGKDAMLGFLAAPANEKGNYLAANLAASELDEARRLIEDSKIDLCEWFLQGGTVEDFENLLVTAKKPVEILIDDAKKVDDDESQLLALEDVLTAIHRERPALQGQYLKRLKRRLRLPFTIDDLRKEARVFAKSAERRQQTRPTDGEAPAQDGTGPPQILVEGGELHNIVDALDKTFADQPVPTIFQRGNCLVRPVRYIPPIARMNIDRPLGAWVLQSVDAPFLMDRATASATFLVNDVLGPKAIDCPNKVARAYLSRGQWNLPRILGVCEAPTLRCDGTVIETPGYDVASGLFLAMEPRDRPTIPADPSPDEIRTALETLKEPFSRFPFLSDSDLSVTIACVLTALVRRTLRSAPMFAFRAPTMGSGKSLLADVVSLIATGRPASVMSQGKDDNEDKKRLLALLVDGDLVVVIDNIERPLGGDSICSVLTQETYKDRILGESKVVSVPTNVLWIATGNNMQFEGDIVTRVVLCDLDPQCERPEEREFKGNLRTDVLQQRDELVDAGLTLLLGYLSAGSPKQELVTFGRFEEWSNLVRSAVVWCGLPDPCETRRRLIDADPVTAQLRELLGAWDAVFGGMDIGVAELCSAVDGNLRQALLEIAGEREEVNRRRLGRYLARMCGRIQGGRRIEKLGSRSGSARWRIHRVERPPDGTDSVDVIGSSNTSGDSRAPEEVDGKAQRKPRQAEQSAPNTPSGGCENQPRLSSEAADADE